MNRTAQANTPPTQQPLPNIMQCPAVSALHKDPQKMTWSAQGDWRGFEQSFAGHIQKFLGVQWQGVNVGNVVCLYAAQEKIAFPIMLHFNRLVFLPTHRLGKWGKKSKGYTNCKSNRPKDCRFMVRTPKKTMNIYQEASELKGMSSQTQSF